MSSIERNTDLDLLGMYSDIKNALNVQRDGYHIEFNCDDDWAEFSHTNGEGYRESCSTLLIPLYSV